MLQHLLISSIGFYNYNHMDIVNDNEPVEIEKELPHDQNDLKDSDIRETPNGMKSRVFVFVLCNCNTCLPQSFV